MSPAARIGLWLLAALSLWAVVGIAVFLFDVVVLGMR